MKTERVLDLLADIPNGPGDLRFRAYFHHFNAGRYYEAHDVLESLWLQQGPSHPDHAFHKGLIQLAGAFVHLRLHHLHPHHHAHGRRLGPALRLLLLAKNNLAPYPALHLGFPTPQALHLIARTARALHLHPDINPWTPDALPQLSIHLPQDGP